MSSSLAPGDGDLYDLVRCATLQHPSPESQPADTQLSCSGFAHQINFLVGPEATLKVRENFFMAQLEADLQLLFATDLFRVSQISGFERWSTSQSKENEKDKGN
jgi:hypothetical protein